MKAFVVAACALAALLAALPAPAGATEPGPVLEAMTKEIQRSMKGLARSTPAPYFISYRVTDIQRTDLHAAYGAIGANDTSHRRWLDVEVRVGDYQLDNTHRIKKEGGFFGFHIPQPVAVPIEDDPAALRDQLWLETDKQYKQAVEKFSEVARDKTLRVEERDQSADFSREPPHRTIGKPARLEVDTVAWAKRLRRYSRMFLDHPEITESRVGLSAKAQTKYFASSEGTVLRHGRIFVRLSLYAKTRAEDGMELMLHDSFDVRTPAALPKEREVRAAISRLCDNLQALRKAPVMEPYTGPAILTGKAAGVFFHEIFGHRIEGHRQKDERDGQTFTRKVGEPILPAIVSVIDDPTLEAFEGQDLRGHYRFDDEGVPARKVTVVDGGVLKNFLMSRTPVVEFDRSNGHGRAQHGYSPVARQGNLIIRGSDVVPDKRLRAMLIEACKKQDKPFGLLFSEVSGGFTFTGRGIPQAFDVHPLLVYRVYADGRPDELVRGVELIGTPLTSFSRIIALGDENEVFNGTCGAESGGVPVSAIAPGVLTEQIEVQKKEKSADRPPLLPPPPAKGATP